MQRKIEKQEFPIPDHTLFEVEATMRGALRVQVYAVVVVATAQNMKPIKVIGGEIARVVDEAEAALIAAQVPVMVRAGMLVQPITEKRKASHGRETEVTILRRLNAATLGYLLNKHATSFVKFDGRRNSWHYINPPEDVTHTLLTKDKWTFPKVAGVITAPTLRPDGSVLIKPGYDKATQLWHAPDSSVCDPPISTKREDAEASLKLLKKLLIEFPFVSLVDLSVGLAYLMTPVLRGACDVVPLLATTAYAPASGKSFGADLACYILRGMPCPVTTVPDKENEFDKKLGALLLESAQIISLDNSSHPFGGDTLCQMTERPVVHIRILGKSEMPECEWRGTTFANGNGLRLIGDMTRRTLLNNLDPGLERPEQRHFKYDPVKLIMDNRAAYVGAILTIARAYLASGNKVECQPLASYGQWSRIVREPLLWLGEEDPVKSMEQLRELDPIRNNARELIMHWKTYLQLGTSYTARQIVDAAELGTEDQEGRRYARPEFRDLLLGRCSEGRIISPKRVGNWLMSIRGQIHQGFKIELVVASDKHGNRYQLVKQEAQASLPLDR